MLEEHELDIDAAPVDFEEALEARRDLTALSAAPLQLLGNVLRCIARPALAGVEADDADRAAVQPVHQVVGDVRRLTPAAERITMANNLNRNKLRREFEHEEAWWNC